jgi:hypothetical protein
MRARSTSRRLDADCPRRREAGSRDRCFRHNRRASRRDDAPVPWPPVERRCRLPAGPGAAKAGVSARCRGESVFTRFLDAALAFRVGAALYPLDVVRSLSVDRRRLADLQKSSPLGAYLAGQSERWLLRRRWRYLGRSFPLWDLPVALDLVGGFSAVHDARRLAPGREASRWRKAGVSVSGLHGCR